MFIYSDLNGFSPTIKPVLTDIESIYQSLFNILNTQKGERIFEPEFGIALEDYVFELADDITALAILQEIVTAVNKFEGRVKVNLRQTTLVPFPDESKFVLTLYFDIIGMDGQQFQFRGDITQ